MPYERLAIPESRDGWIMEYRPADLSANRQLHAHRELEINLVQQGRGSYLIQGGRYPIRAGALLWLFPGQPHLLVEASADFSMWVAVFRPRLVRRLTGDSAGNAAVLSRKDPGCVHVQELQEQARAFLDAVLRRLSDIEPGAHAWFNHGLGFLLRTAWEAGQSARLLPSVARVHPAVERSLHALRNGESEGSLAGLATKSGLSYSRLCTLFSAQMGESLGHCRNRMRVQRFKALVAAHPRRTLLDLAFEAGFGSYAQCHRMVLRHTGRPPARLR